MSNEFITAPDGPDIRDSYFRFPQGRPFADRADDGPTPFSFAETGPPSEADLLPDEETDSVFRQKSFLNQYEYDVAVIGGGPAGYTAAIRASKLGAKVILFEKETLGGLAASGGIIANLTKSFSNKNNVVTSLTTHVARLLRSCRVRVEAGEACLKSAHEVLCRGKVYNVSKVILCGGTAPGRPDFPGSLHKGVWMFSDIFKAKEAPPRLMVLGGGSAGCEIAAAFSAAGSNVMLIEPEPRLLSGMDAQLAEAVREALLKAGVKVHLGISVKEITDRGGCPYVITELGGVLCDKFLVATKPRLDVSSLGALAGEIAHADEVIKVDAYLETNIQGIYAAGDCTGLGFQTHAAYKTADTAAVNAMGSQKALELRAVPATVFTTPGAASVGMSEEEARDRYGDEMVVGAALLSANARAMMTGATEGFVKVLVGKRYGEIYGVHIFAEQAAEMIAEPAALMSMEVTVHEVCGEIVHAHPTYAEAFAEACADALGKGVRA